MLGCLGDFGGLHRWIMCLDEGSELDCRVRRAVVRSNVLVCVGRSIAVGLWIGGGLGVAFSICCLLGFLRRACVGAACLGFREVSCCGCVLVLWGAPVADCTVGLWRGMHDPGRVCAGFQRRFLMRGRGAAMHLGTTGADSGTPLCCCPVGALPDVGESLLAGAQESESVLAAFVFGGSLPPPWVFGAGLQTVHPRWRFQKCL